MASPSFLSGASVFVTEANSYKRLTDEEVLDLALARNVDALIKHHMFIVSQVATRFSKSPVGIEDLLAVGMFGLMKACKKYRPKKGPLHKLARIAIEHEMIRLIQSQKRSDIRQYGAPASDVHILHIEEPFFTGCRDLTESYLEGKAQELCEDVLTAKRYLFGIAQHIQQIIEGARSQLSRRDFCCFVYYYELEQPRQRGTLTPYASELGFQSHCGLISSAKRTWPAIKNLSIHEGGHTFFKEEISLLNYLQEYTETIVTFDTDLEAA